MAKGHQGWTLFWKNYDRLISSTRIELTRGPVFSSRLVIEEVTPDAVYYIESTAAGGEMNVRMLLKLPTVRMQSAEDTDLHALSASPPEHGPGGCAEQNIEQGPVVIEKRVTAGGAS